MDRVVNLFRISLKAVIFDNQGKVLVVKEHGRDWWDIPGGGLEQGESIKEGLARELREEVSLESDFSFKVILVEDARYQQASDIYQMRITFLVQPESLKFAAGEDSDEMKFIDPNEYKDSELFNEQKIYEYSQLALGQ